MQQQAKNEKIFYAVPLITGLVLIGILVGIRWWALTRPVPLTAPVEQQFSGISLTELKQEIESVFKEKNVTYRQGRRSAQGQEFWLAEVPYGIPIPAIHLSLQESLDSLNVEIISAESNPLNNHVRLSMGWQDSVLLHIQLSPADVPVTVEAAIAILIDDFGSIWSDREIAFTQLDIPLTVSVIPGSGRSRHVSAEMAKRGCEVLLHMPMEPYNIKVKDNGYLITTGMGLAEIESRFRKAISEVPDLVGVNNHMGSRVSSHQETISNVLSVIKKEGFYFLDSRTIAETVAYKTAQQMGIPSGFRDIFLDADNSESEIMRQIRDLKKKAKRNGRAIAIGHCRQNTLKILQREIPKMKTEGFTFVFVSQLIR